MSSRKTDVSLLTTFMQDKTIQLFFHFDCKRVVTYVSGLYFGKNIMKTNDTTRINCNRLETWSNNLCFYFKITFFA